MVKQLTYKYRNMSSPMKAALWFTVCNILQKGISFFTVPILTRLMSPDDYGKYSVFQSWYQIISIFATLNMWNYVLNNGMIRYENDRPGYVSSLQGLSTLITAGLFLIYIPFSGLWEGFTSLSFITMAIMFLELLFMPSFEYWCSKERFEFRYKGVVALSLAVTIAVPAISIPLVIVSSDKGMAAIIGKAVTSAVIYIIPAIIIAKNGKHFFIKDYWKFALRFVLPLIPHFLAGVVLQQSDRIMIANIAGDDKAGIYSVAYSAAMVIIIFNSAVLASFTPYTYNSIKNNSCAGIRRVANYLVALIAGLNLALICVAPEAIKLLGPEEYHDAMYVIPPVALSGIFMFLFNLFANIEYYFEKTTFVAIASIGSAVLNVVLNAIFIPVFGYIAAGYTTLICYILYSVCHYIMMRYVLKTHMNNQSIYNMRLIVTVCAEAIVAAAGILAVYDFPLIRYLIIFALCVVCFIKRKEITSLIHMIGGKNNENNSLDAH